ncbi:hypothetical protein [Zavarzinella formosa]|uniref:hypothetical protein n=1 Tax=Zavarzinella formosa TaxID=360055 RepID=UPI00030AB502|nr:hypothetical protein [Zavarzinella formosa]
MDIVSKIDPANATSDACGSMQAFQWPTSKLRFLASLTPNDLEFIQGYLEGRREGEQLGYLKGKLEHFLERRFGEAGLAVMERFREIKDIAFLERMVAQVRTASLEEFERAIGE